MAAGTLSVKGCHSSLRRQPFLNKTLPCGVTNSPRWATPSVEIKLKEKRPSMTAHG